MQYRVTKGKSFTADNEPIPVGTIFEADEVPAFLVGKVEPIPEGLEASGEMADLNASDDEVKTDLAASIAPKTDLATSIAPKADAPAADAPKADAPAADAAKK